MSDSIQQQTRKSLEVALDTVALNPNMPMEMRLGVASQVILELSQRPTLFLRGRRRRYLGVREGWEPMQLSDNPEKRSDRIYVPPPPEDQHLIDIACGVVREVYANANGVTEGIGQAAWDALYECVNPSVLEVLILFIETDFQHFGYNILRYPMEYLRPHVSRIFDIYKQTGRNNRRAFHDDIAIINCLSRFAIEDDDIYNRFKRSFASTKHRNVKAHLCLALHEIDKAREKRQKKSKRAKSV